MLTVGTKAPEFELASSAPEKKFKLSDMRGKRVVIAFYPADWTPVCSSELTIYNEALDFFKNQNTEIVGLSVDSVWCHIAFSLDRKFDFPLLADFEPKGAVAKLYGVYRQEDGTCDRALFVIDADGLIHWSHVSPIGVNPGAAGIFSALEELQHQHQTQ